VSARRAFWVLALAAVVLLVHAVLVAAAAHGHVAHALLGAGNATPPAGPAAIAIALVVVRVLAIVVVPGAVLAALSALVAHVAVGPAGRGRGDRAQGRALEGAAGDDGTASSSGAGSSLAAGTGTSIDARGTV
jgi:hypothetical protein